MKTDKKPVIGFICVMLSCILVIGITIGLLSSAGNEVAEGSTTDTTDTTAGNTTDTTDNTKEPPVDEEHEKPALEGGFGSSGGGNESLSGRIAYRSDTNIFDVEDVRLTVYYGGVFGSDIEFYRENGRNIPIFYIICYNVDTHDLYQIREVNENFISEEYRIPAHYYGGDYEIAEFKHSEEIVIPNEAFQGDQGAIELIIWGQNVNVRSGMEPEWMTIACSGIYYTMVEPSKVLLTPGWYY